MAEERPVADTDYNESLWAIQHLREQLIIGVEEAEKYRELAVDALRKRRAAESLATTEGDLAAEMFDRIARQNPELEPF